MKKIRKVLIYLILIAISATSFIFRNSNKIQASSEPSVIQNFWESFDSSNDCKWYNLMASSITEHYRSFANDYKNEISKIGILAVKQAQLLKIYQVTKDDVPYYPELEKYKKEYYRVVVNLQTYKDNQYFTNGINEYYMTVVSDEGGKKIGSLSKRYPEYSHKFGWGFANAGSEPYSINVKDQNYKVHNVSLHDFAFNVVCNEIGNLNYSKEAIKANILAVKMCGWWAVRAAYRAADGCDIMWGDVTFLNHNLATTQNQSYIANCFDDVFDYDVYANNNKIFYMNYEAGGFNGYGKNSGVMRQNGSNYLASSGYSWRDILHYYYDNSGFNNPDTGIISIR